MRSRLLRLFCLLGSLALAGVVVSAAPAEAAAHAKAKSAAKHGTAKAGAHGRASDKHDPKKGGSAKGSSKKASSKKASSKKGGKPDRRGGKGRVVAVERPPVPIENVGYAGCGEAPAKFAQAAAVNSRSLDTLEWAPFGPTEHGWQVYEFLIGREIGTSCGVGTAVFAQSLATFQAKFNLTADGVFTPATFEVLKGLWQERRAFVMERVRGVCPDAPVAEALAVVPKDQETFDREDRKVKPEVLGAYDRMVAAAKAEVAALKTDPKALSIFSAFRAPEADAVRCDHEKNCDGARRAACSSHRTATALDLDVGWAPGLTADSTDNANRLMQTRGAAYRWLVENAGRFGFVNYPYEPWHWEWIGEGAPAATAANH